MYKNSDDMTLKEFGELPANHYQPCNLCSGDFPEPFTEHGSGVMPDDEPTAFTYAGVSRDCFGCGKMMIEDFPELPHNPLWSNWLGATDWTSMGNWCSQKLDCMLDPNYKKAHIVICDECFEERKDRIVLIEHTHEEKHKRIEDADKVFREFQESLRNELSKDKDSEPKND